MRTRLAIGWTDGQSGGTDCSVVMANQKKSINPCQNRRIDAAGFRFQAGFEREEETQHIRIRVLKTSLRQPNGAGYGAVALWPLVRTTNVVNNFTYHLHPMCSRQRVWRGAWGVLVTLRSSVHRGRDASHDVAGQTADPHQRAGVARAIDT